MVLSKLCAAQGWQIFFESLKCTHIARLGTNRGYDKLQDNSKNRDMTCFGGLNLKNRVLLAQNIDISFGMVMAHLVHGIAMPCARFISSY